MNFLDGYYDTISKIKSKAARAELSLAILEYHYEGTEPEFKSEVAEVAFTALRWSLDNSRAKAEAGSRGASKREANRKQTASKPEAEAQANAKQTPSKGGSKPEAKGDANAKQKPMQTPSKGPSKSDAKEKEEVKETPPKGGVKKTPFSPPTKADVAEYVKEHGIAIDPERFIDYYTANGWRVGRNPMKDWRAAVRNWARSDFRDATKGVSVDDELRSYDQEL